MSSASSSAAASAASAAMASTAGCKFSSNTHECFTASWFLIWDQFRLFLLIQVPILFLSMMYDWLEMSHYAFIERLRSFLAAPMTQLVNYMLQLVASTYVCIAWIVRGGSLSVALSWWTAESTFMFITAVSYVLRWGAAKHKLRFTMELNALFDLLSTISHFAIAGQVYQNQYSWLDFGFVRSYCIYHVVDKLFSRYQNKTFYAELLLVIFKVACLVFFAAAVLFSLERLGDFPYTNSYLLHVYKCYDESNTHYIFQKTSTPLNDDYPNCSETWSAFVSIYFMFVTVSTVGYGDFSPKTVLGQLMVCIIIVVGIYTFANESAAMFQIYADQRSGRGQCHLARNAIHVVVTGNPSVAQMKDFIREFFHPDHEDLFHGTALSSSSSDSSASSNGDQGQHLLNSKWTRLQKRNRVTVTHIILLMEFDQANNDDDSPCFQEQIEQFVDENPLYRRRVSLLHGTPLNKEDLDRAQTNQALAVFFLPNKFSSDANQEDAANVLRVLSVSQRLGPQASTQLFAILANSENRILFEATGIPEHNIVCSDEIKLGLMGLSCRCPGLSTLVSNLITSRSSLDDVLDEPSDCLPLWIREYVGGSANEIYSCYLHERFHGLTFTQAAQMIHRETLGQAVMIAMEFQNEILFNPGHRFVVHPSCKGYMIAESIGVLTQFMPTKFPQTSGLLNMAILRARKNLIARARRAQNTVERRVPKSVRDQIFRMEMKRLNESQDDTASLRIPAPELLSRGDHIVVCSNVTNEGGSQRCAQRLVHFLQPLRAAHIERVVPVVIVDSEYFDDVSWMQLQEFGDVYQVQGSPQKHQVLVAAGVYTASAIVVLAQGSKSGYDDSKAIFNAILVTAALKANKIFTIIELRDINNNRFLDPVASFASQAAMQDSLEKTMIRTSSYNNVNNDRLSAGSGRVSSRRRGVSSASMSRDSRGRTVSKPMRPKRRWFRGEIFYILREFFWDSLNTEKTSKSGDSQQDLAVQLREKLLQSEEDTFFQERFICGALFPSYVADDLLIQSFFNPSLNAFIRSILDGKSCFMLYDLPKKWRAGKRRYGELFESMTSGIAHALPIGLLRVPSEANGATHPYVYTCPHSDTVLHPDDKVFVLIDVASLHQIATKLQTKYLQRHDPHRVRRMSMADVVLMVMQRQKLQRRAAPPCSPTSSSVSSPTFHETSSRKGVDVASL